MLLIFKKITRLFSHSLNDISLYNHYEMIANKEKSESFGHLPWYRFDSSASVTINFVKGLQITTFASLVMIMSVLNTAWAEYHSHGEDEHHDTHLEHDYHQDDPNHDHHEPHDHDHDSHQDDSHSNKVSKFNEIRSQRRYISIADLPASIRNKTEVAVSNYPLFLLSQAVTKGAPSAKLLLDSGDIGHHASLSPSDMKTIKDSRYVIWFGNELESNLAKPFASSPNTISLFSINGFHRLPLRDEKGQSMEGTLDPHIWLDPYNAKAITRALGAIFSRANPEYQDVYQKNVKQFAKDMDRAVANTKVNMSTTNPYWAYHDAYRYLESTLNLTLAGSLTRDHHLPPKASQFYWLNQTKPKETMCMVLQSENNDGALTKLKPIRSTVQQEDMSDAQDFIAGWLDMANDINSCVRQRL